MDPIADPERIQSRAPVTAEHAAPTVAANPRTALLAHLSADMTAALAAGDLEAAAVAHEAIGRLLAPVMRSAEDAGDGAKVVDLDAERVRRAGRNA